jgi:hypothetical protein
MARTTLTIPFAHLNLRRNPFGERTPEERAALAVVDTGPWEARLAEPRGVVQFVGESGRGKTTRMLALRRRFPAAPFLRIFEEASFNLPVAPMLFVDEVQYLPRRHLRALFAGPAVLVLGSHVDFTAELRAAGRPVETVHLRGLSEDLLAAIVTARIEDARRSPGPVPVVGSATLRALIAAHGDDVRAIENRLYDAVQEMEAPGHVQV